MCFIQIRRLLVTLNMTDIYAYVIQTSVQIKYQSYPESTTIDAFEQKLYICHNLIKLIYEKI